MAAPGEANGGPGGTAPPPGPKQQAPNRVQVALCRNQTTGQPFVMIAVTDNVQIMRAAYTDPAEAEKIAMAILAVAVEVRRFQNTLA